MRLCYQLNILSGGKSSPSKKNCLWKNFEQKKTYEKIYAPSPLAEYFSNLPLHRNFPPSEIAQVTHF